MRQLVPNLILENYLVGSYHGEFPAVGLFVDISGFSTLTDSLMQHGQQGAEVLAQIMLRVFGPPSRSIQAQGGFIVGYAGDAFTALFPLGAEPLLTLRRALAVAWAIQAQMTAEPFQATEYGEFPISAKVGLALGETAWGILRSRDGERATYYFRGTAITAAAAAEHHAKAGEIVITQRFYEQVLEKVQVEPVAGDFRLLSIEGDLPAARPVPASPPSAQAMCAFFPENLLYKDLRSEFRQALNLFISLPELPTLALETFIESVFELQALYGGLFTRIDYGDKGCNLLLFWGAPHAYENDIERALNFILDLRAQVDFKFSAGITYYISRAGFMGSDLMEEYTCYGWGINLAARLMLTAARGEIWLDERVAKRAEQRFQVDFIGEQTFKGFAHPQKVFTLRGRKDSAESFFQGVMVGRDDELRALASFVAPLWEGKYAGSLRIWGDPGIGKSRLVHEFRTSQVFVRHKTLWGLCQSDQILREPFNPFSYWLRHYFNLSDSHDEISNKNNFELKLSGLLEATPDPALAAELDHARSFLAALVDLYWPDALYTQMDARGRYDNTFIALMALVKAESLRQPVIIFIEDAQYLDEDSSALVQALMRSLKAGPALYPVAILSTARREGAALPLDRSLCEQQLDLDRLSNSALAQLAQSILGSLPAVDLLELLEERADGNPFFAEQILRYLREESLLESGTEGWSASKKSYAATIPTDIKAVLIARLDQLTREVRNVIQTASVLGREFETRILAEMLRDDSSLAGEIQQAEQAAIWSALNEIRYIFKHAMLRDAAYLMQMQVRRQELHALAVEALENVFAGQLEAHFGELAYHAEQAQLIDKACAYLEQAGDQARNSFQNVTAAAYYTRALLLLAPEATAAQYRFRLALNDVYSQIGDREKQKHNLAQLQQLAGGEVRKQAEVANLETSFLDEIGEHHSAFEKAKETISLAREAGDDETVVCAHVYCLDVLYKLDAGNEVKAYAEAGLSLARQIGFQEGEAQLLNIYGLFALKQREPEAARARLERSLEIYLLTNNLRRQAYPLANLGMVASYLGDYAAAQTYYEKSLAISREVGHRAGESLILQNLGWILGMRGDYQAARAHLERSLRLSRETGHRTSELYALINLSACTETLGEAETAFQSAYKALILARETSDRNGEAWAQTYLGHSLSALGRLEAARTAYLSSLNLRSALKQTVLATEPAAGLARLALEGGDLSVAQRYLQATLEHLETGGTLDGTDQPLRIYQTCYLVLRRAGHKKATSILEMAYQALMKRVDLIADEPLRRNFLEKVPYHREILRAWEASGSGLD